MSVFGEQNFKNCFCFRACFQVICLSISDSKFRRLGLLNRGFRMESIAKDDISWKSCLMNFGIDVYCFLEALRAAFLVFQALKTGLKTKRFF